MSTRIKVNLKEDVLREWLCVNNMQHKDFAKNMRMNAKFFSQLLSGFRHPGIESRLKILKETKFKFEDIFYIE